MARRGRQQRDVFIKDDWGSIPDELPSLEAVEPGTYVLRVGKPELGKSRAQKPKVQVMLKVLEVIEGDEEAVEQQIPYSISLSSKDFPAVQRKQFLTACGVKYNSKKGGWSMAELEDAVIVAEVGIREFEGRDVNDLKNPRPYDEEEDYSGEADEDEEEAEYEDEMEEYEEEEEELPEDEEEDEEEYEEYEEEEEEEEPPPPPKKKPKKKAKPKAKAKKKGVDKPKKKGKTSKKKGAFKGGAKRKTNKRKRSAVR